MQDFEAKGARLAVIGSGWPAMARAFADKAQLPDGMRLLCDPKLEAFRLAGLHRSAALTLNPLAVPLYLRALLRGHRQGKISGDPWQQGGALVIGRGGEVLFRQASLAPGHHASPKKMLAALPA